MVCSPRPTSAPQLVIVILTTLVAMAVPNSRFAAAFQTYQAEIPNGDKVMVNGVPWPGVGHTVRSGGVGGNGGNGGANLNGFGQAFIAANRVWTTALCEADSDDDGQSNGFELGDPDCTWTKDGGDSSLNRTSDISHPGLASSMTNHASPAALGTANEGGGSSQGFLPAGYATAPPAPPVDGGSGFGPGAGGAPRAPAHQSPHHRHHMHHQHHQYPNGATIGRNGDYGVGGDLSGNGGNGHVGHHHHSAGVQEGSEYNYPLHPQSHSGDHGGKPITTSSAPSPNGGDAATTAPSKPDPASDHPRGKALLFFLTMAFNHDVDTIRQDSNSLVFVVASALKIANTSQVTIDSIRSGSTIVQFRIEVEQGYSNFTSASEIQTTIQLALQNGNFASFAASSTAVIVTAAAASGSSPAATQGAGSTPVDEDKTMLIITVALLTVVLLLALVIGCALGCYLYRKKKQISLQEKMKVKGHLGSYFEEPLIAMGEPLHGDTASTTSVQAI